MLLSRQLAGFTRGQSDTLRKAMGKKLIEKMNELKGKFLEGGTAKGHSKEVLEKIWAEWEKFASYAFNKSHATCYSWVAFQTGYLKANYPAEFMAAVLSRNLDDINKMSFYMDECKAMGLQVKGPDINESFSNFAVSEPGVIRFGLSAIKGIGADVVRTIIDTRTTGGKFKDIYDFVERVPAQSINRRVFDNLVLAGAFDCFDGVKREDLSAEVGKRGETVAEQLLRYGAQRQNESKMAATSLFGFDDEQILAESRPKIPASPAWDNLVRLNKERDLVGMYLSAHPLDAYWLEVSKGVELTAAEKNDITSPTPTPIAFAGMVVSTEDRKTASGTMSIVKVEDYSGATDFAIFEKQKAEFGHLCIPGTAVYVIGTFKEVVNRSTGVKNLRFQLDRVLPLDGLRGKLIDEITLKVNPSQIGDLMGFLDNSKISGQAPSGGVPPVPLSLTVYASDIGRKLTFSTALRVNLSKAFFKTLDDLAIDYSLRRHSMIAG